MTAGLLLKQLASLTVQEISLSVSVGSDNASSATKSTSTAANTQTTTSLTTLSGKPTTIFSVGSGNASSATKSTSTAANTQTTTSLTTLSGKPTTILYDLNTEYTSIIAVAGAGFGALILFVCCKCVVHSWWLRKKKYTDVNSRSLSDAERKRRKIEEREARKKEKGMICRNNML